MRGARVSVDGRKRDSLWVHDKVDDIPGVCSAAVHP